jgi:hypothetical protein
MLTYQVRPRVFRIEKEKSFAFPSEGEARFVFAPLQPFGVEAGNGRTAVRAVAASVLFNANTGAHTITSKSPMKPLEVTLREPRRTVEFADPPVVERVEGTIGGVGFRWELKEWHARFRTTTQEVQESAVASSWERIGLLSVPGRRRLLAALHYFHVAVRLARQGGIAGEFLPEMILNLAKTLEVLFPPDGDGRTRDAARKGLSQLGFSDVDIEADYIPAMALRNEIDVGHVDLSLFKLEQLALIHAYVGRAEDAYRELLHRVLQRVQSGDFEVKPYEPTSARAEAVAIVDRLRQYADRYKL